MPSLNSGQAITRVARQQPREKYSRTMFASSKKGKGEQIVDHIP